MTTAESKEDEMTNKTDNIDIAGLDKAKVFAALYAAARPQGMGFLHFVPGPMDPEEAQSWVDNTPGLYADYVNGRVMKVCLAGDSFDPWGFDRDNGAGAAAKAIDTIRIHP